MIPRNPHQYSHHHNFNVPPYPPPTNQFNHFNSISDHPFKFSAIPNAQPYQNSQPNFFNRVCNVPELPNNQNLDGKIKKFNNELITSYKMNNEENKRENMRHEDDFFKFKKDRAAPNKSQSPLKKTENMKPESTYQNYEYKFKSFELQTNKPLSVPVDYQQDRKTYQNFGGRNKINSNLSQEIRPKVFETPPKQQITVSIKKTESNLPSTVKKVGNYHNADSSVKKQPETNYLNLNIPNQSRQTSQKPKDSYRSNDQISYTKYLLLEFKNEELDSEIKLLKQKVQDKQKAIQSELQHHRGEVKLLATEIQGHKEQYKELLARKRSQTDSLVKKHGEQLESQKNIYLKLISQKNQQIKKQKTTSEQKYRELEQVKDKQIKNLKEKITKFADRYRQQIAKTYLKGLIEKYEQIKIKESGYLTRIDLLKEEIQEKTHKLAEYEQKEQKIQAESQQLSSNLSQIIYLLNRTQTNNPSLEQTVNSQFVEAKLLNKAIQTLQQQKLQMKEKLQEEFRMSENLHNEYKMQLIKEKSERKKQGTELGIKIHHLQNQVFSLRQKLRTIEDKYKLVVDENKNKDEFIYKYMINKCSELGQQQIKTKLQEFTEDMGNVYELRDKVREAQQEIRKLQQIINL